MSEVEIEIIPVQVTTADGSTAQITHIISSIGDSFRGEIEGGPSIMLWNVMGLARDNPNFNISSENLEFRQLARFILELRSQSN